MSPFPAGAWLADGLEVIGHIARSQATDVYDAWSEPRGCRVAVKALRPDRAGDAHARAALLREGRLLERLAHPHLVRAYEVLDGEQPVVVLETLRGTTLEAILATRPLSVAEAAELGLQLGSALRYLNGEGLVHLDVGPANVIAHAGAAKLIDLSIVRRPGNVEAGLGGSSSIAPEQARGGFAGPAADVWGLGTILYEALTGEPPFAKPNGSQPCLARRADRLRRERPRLPPALADAVDATLEPDPTDRPEIEELLEVLDAHTARLAGPGRWRAG